MFVQAEQLMICYAEQKVIAGHGAIVEYKAAFTRGRPNIWSVK